MELLRGWLALMGLVVFALVFIILPIVGMVHVEDRLSPFGRGVMYGLAITVGFPLIIFFCYLIGDPLLAWVVTG